MKKVMVTLLIGQIVFVFAGCGIRSIHPQKFDRVDQRIEGNRGYLKGTPPPAEDRTGLKRELMAVDVDLGAEESKFSKIVEKAARAGEKKEADIK